ncbi:sce7725 family protein [Enterococcus thailandicus]|uniref:sce7725 family protein n=1 Tax=Enterococcus thailandicus TaxID=417368 RepID=UPI00094BEE2E|nr:sce7725 family protein [Enterococcus thailandicus]GMC00015.1 hypothetical protein K2F_02740 [Enterococcus thailandicus]
MYYPYLRGKQFDLLALKEAINRNVLSTKVQPIIEPVRDSATLKNVVELFQKKKQPLIVIDNPQVGQFKLFQEHLHPWTEMQKSSIRHGLILTPQNFQEIVNNPPEWLIFDGQYYLRESASWKKLANNETKFVIPDKSRLRIWLPENKIILRDSFQTKKYVENYAEKPDDFFSDDYLFHREDGYVGFADFTIEGSRYFDKGYPSRALGIHLTYVDAYGNIRVKHFISDSNESAKDQAVKFFEAAAKMKNWVWRNQDQLLITSGMIELLLLEKKQKFPGLGVLKKWSLLHHLELMSQLVEHPTNWLKEVTQTNRLQELDQ